VCQTARLDQFAQFAETDHQIGPHLEVGRLFLTESEIAEDVADSIDESSWLTGSVVSAPVGD